MLQGPAQRLHRRRTREIGRAGRLAMTRQARHQDAESEIRQLPGQRQKLSRVTVLAMDEEHAGRGSGRPYLRHEDVLDALLALEEPRGVLARDRARQDLQAGLGLERAAFAI